MNHTFIEKIIITMHVSYIYERGRSTWCAGIAKVDRYGKSIVVGFRASLEQVERYFGRYLTFKVKNCAKNCNLLFPPEFILKR